MNQLFFSDQDNAMLHPNILLLFAKISLRQFQNIYGTVWKLYEVFFQDLLSIVQILLSSLFLSLDYLKKI
jgi:hypothetical protein